MSTAWPAPLGALNRAEWARRRARPALGRVGEPGGGVRPALGRVGGPGGGVRPALGRVGGPGGGARPRPPGRPGYEPAATRTVTRNVAVIAHFLSFPADGLAEAPGWHEVRDEVMAATPG